MQKRNTKIMNTPQLSLIISFYNKIQILEKVFESISLQTFTDFEVIIADDGSEGNVVARIKQLQQKYPFRIKHIWHEDLGWRKNIILNKAVVAAEAEYVVFIDGDCLLEKHFLEDHYNSRKMGEVITGRRVLLTQNITDTLLNSSLNTFNFKFKLFFKLLYETLFFKQKTLLERFFRLPRWMRKIFIIEKRRYILGCNFSLYKSDLLSVNGFDERFLYPGYGEDTDLELRLERKGIPAMSRQCQLIQFHCFHKHFDTNYEPNKQLLRENTTNHITYTPYGIHQ
jgi:glycosyltransferase involved in cell wall biosynthesis